MIVIKAVFAIVVTILAISGLFMVPIAFSSYRDNWIWNGGICRKDRAAVVSDPDERRED